MDSSRLKAEHLLYGLGLYHTARALYGMTPPGRRSKRYRGLKRAFYEKLLKPGDLVFDIGANLGSYSEIFASLGTRVVAVEPNPDCVSHIRRSYSHYPIDVVSSAVGSAPGVGTIRIARRSDMSSMSPDWIERISKAHSLARSLWDNDVTVPIVTLDLLCKRYGVPAFIKIDVEGFEVQVLEGLSNNPALLSFEFNTHLLDATSRCLTLMHNLHDCEFNYVIGEPTHFELIRWVGADELYTSLTSLDRRCSYGDVFVRRRGSPALR